MIEPDEIPLAPLDAPQLVEVRVHRVEEEYHNLQSYVADPFLHVILGTIHK